MCGGPRPAERAAPRPAKGRLDPCGAPMPPSDDGGRAAVCRFHSTGFCAKGGSCPFRHDDKEQPSNVHIPAAHREAYERAIRGLSVDRGAQGGSPGNSGSGTPLTGAGGSPTPAEAAEAAAAAAAEAAAAAAEAERQRLAEEKRREVMHYFTVNLLSPRRRDPGGHDEQTCVQVFAEYIGQLMAEAPPLWEGFVEWCDRFNASWGPHGRGVAKWLQHRRLGPFLAEHLGFQWGSRAQQEAMHQAAHAAQYQQQVYYEGPPHGGQGPAWYPPQQPAPPPQQQSYYRVITHQLPLQQPPAPPPAGCGAPQVVGGPHAPPPHPQHGHPGWQVVQVAAGGPQPGGPPAPQPHPPPPGHPAVYMAQQQQQQYAPVQAVAQHGGTPHPQQMQQQQQAPAVWR
eukprot:TRINITY_DN6767_c0_g2_i2.p1 TRINITY_DN6767_c0_g2~~TRINITY_DN6767_c0_g2_i2.p1  ORF type:complete len:396 (+),score=89.36 TRINITY_DN6767_c0_g2_i2:90-1277(+)